MYDNQRISVVMPAYNEETGIFNTVKSFVMHPYVDEVVVADNDSKDKTAELAKKAGARVVLEKQPGYGFACRKALASARGDLVALTESDNSFYAEDLNLFLAYIPYFDMVKGARSNVNLIERDADWSFGLAFSNWAIAKYMQVLYFGKDFYKNMHMREMGGTYRVIKRKALDAILPHLFEGQGAFLADLTTIALRKRLKVLEIPIRYRRRLGVSKTTGNRRRAAVVALRMIWVISKNRFKKFS